MNVRTAIVILNWNSRDMTAECIRSVLSMDAGEYELILVDNGSQDGSPEYFQREFPQCTVLPQSRNLGFAAGCNVAFREALARGMKYVLPLNNDTIVDRHFLKELIVVAEHNPQAAIISPKIYFYDSPEQFWWAGGYFNLWTGIPRHTGRKNRDVGQFDEPRTLDWATGCALLVRCDVLKQVGLFDEQFFGNGEDLDLSLRIRKAGFEIWFAPKAKLWHKEGVDYRKNAGEQLRKFMGTRNLLWIMRRHASTMQWVTFWPNFLVSHVLFYVALSLWRRDVRSAVAVLRGIAAFVRMPQPYDRVPAAVR